MERKKKLLALSHTSDLTGGAESVLLNIVKSTSDIYDWTVIVPVARGDFYKGLDSMKDVAVEVIFTPWWCSGSSYGQHISRKTHKKSISRICKLVEGADVAITNTIANPWLAYCCTIKRKPHIWYVHEFGDIDHGMDFSLGYRESLEFIDQLSGLVITVSESVKKHITKHATKMKVNIIPQSVDIDNLMVIESSPGKGVKTHVLILGSIKPSKGQLVLLNALAMLDVSDAKRIDCRVSGPVVDPSYFRALKEIEFSNGVSVVFKPEFVNPIVEYLWSDIVVVPSMNEALGRSTIEGLAAGKVVVGADSGATKDLLANGRGYVFEAGNAKSLAGAIHLFLSENGEFLIGVGERQRFVIDNYSKEIERDFFIKCIDDAMERYVSVTASANLLESMGKSGMYEDGVKYRLRRLYIRLRQIAGKLLRWLKLK